MSLVLDLFHVQFTVVRFWWKLMQWSYPWIRCGKNHISGCIRGRGYINSSLDTLPETNLASENRQSPRGKIILKCLILRGYSMLFSGIVHKWHGISILANMSCPNQQVGPFPKETGLLSLKLLLAADHALKRLPSWLFQPIGQILVKLDHHPQGWK